MGFPEHGALDSGHPKVCILGWRVFAHVWCMRSGRERERESARVYDYVCHLHARLVHPYLSFKCMTRPTVSTVRRWVHQGLVAVSQPLQRFSVLKGWHLEFQPHVYLGCLGAIPVVQKTSDWHLPIPVTLFVGWRWLICSYRWVDGQTSTPCPSHET